MATIKKQHKETSLRSRIKLTSEQNKKSENYKEVLESFKSFNRNNHRRYNQLIYTEFFVQNNNLNFEKVIY